MLLLTAAEMRALDRATIEGGVAGAELMERAGRGVALAATRVFGSPLALHVLVLAGAGNNGGDGFVAARHLHVAGARVSVGVLAARDKVQGDARAHLEKLESAGVQPAFLGSDADLVELLAGAASRWDWAVDAILGTGSRGEPEGLLASGCDALRRLRAGGTRIVAVDLPSGVSADDGTASNHAVHADLTVTFGCLKRGQVLHPGRDLCGTLDLVDIGLAPSALAGAGGATLATSIEMGTLVPVRDMRAHKGSVGRVLVVGGAAGMVGAILLAARAASRAGGGYVRVAVPAGLADVVASHVVEQMPVACGEDGARWLDETALDTVLQEAERADAVVLGPGLSRRPGSIALVHDLLSRLDQPLVLDADGLSAISPPDGDPAKLLEGSPGPRILTPHLGEMSRLTGVRPSDLEAHRIDAAREWAQKWRAIVILKGAPTVVAAPDGRTSVNPTGNPGMATAGMGDVLSGTIAALLAQRVAPFDAARLAVYVHGAAGDAAAVDVGPIGLVAGDVADRLPRALARLVPAAPAPVAR
jgi:NAD(P)H-hydrate epimerase